MKNMGEHVAFPSRHPQLRRFVRWTRAIYAAKYPDCKAAHFPWPGHDIGRIKRPSEGRILVSHADEHAGTRRDFLYYATAGAGAVAAGAAVWPLANQMNPSADVQALSSIFVDVSAVEAGTQLTVKYLGKPVFIRRRTEKEIADARTVEMSALIDTTSENPNKPDSDASDANRTLDEAGEWLVMIGVCTHLGCVPIGDGAGDFGGWFCPCHGSHYDTAGRIRKGPAPQNLHIPVAEFTDESTLKLG
jgi:ubiquinol-cytochrome c reductase iron-sulfur subunit